MSYPISSTNYSGAITKTPIGHYMLNAAHATSTAANGPTLISQWSDESGNGNHLIQTDSAKQPTLQAYPESRLPVDMNTGVHFNGNHFLEFDGLNVTDWPIEFWFVAWMDPTSPSGTLGGVVSLINTNQTGYNHCSVRKYTTSSISAFRHNQTRNQPRNSREFTIVRVKWDTTRTTMQQGNYPHEDSYLDNTSVSTTQFPFDTLRVGHVNYNTTDYYLNNDSITEIMVFDDHLTTSDEAAIREYLTDKYDLERKRLVGDNCLYFDGNSICEMKELESKSPYSLTMDFPGGSNATNSSAANWPKLKRPQTVDIWFKPDPDLPTDATDTNYYRIMSISAWKYTGPNCYLVYRPNGKQLYFYTGNASIYVNNFINDRWNVLTVCWNAETELWSVWFNGDLIEEKTILNSFNAQRSRLTLGGWNTDDDPYDHYDQTAINTNSFYKGKIAGFRTTRDVPGGDADDGVDADDGADETSQRRKEHVL